MSAEGLGLGRHRGHIGAYAQGARHEIASHASAMERITDFLLGRSQPPAARAEEIAAQRFVIEPGRTLPPPRCQHSDRGVRGSVL